MYVENRTKIANFPTPPPCTYRPRCIGATTVGTGGDCSPPKFQVGGTNNVLVPLNFLAVVFKKQEISQQVLLLLNENQSFHINYSALCRHFSRYSTSDRRKTKKMCLIPVSTLHSVYLLAYRTAYLDKKNTCGIGA